MVSDGQCFQLSMENMYLYICTYVCIKRNQSQSTIFSNLQSIYDWSLNEGPLVSLIYSVWGFPFCYSLSFFWDEMNIPMNQSVRVSLSDVDITKWPEGSSFRIGKKMVPSLEFCVQDDVCKRLTAPRA
jgi:hypothetical protein